MVINVCDNSILCRGIKSHNEFRKEVKLWLKINYLNKSFINLETEYEIFINNTFIEKVTSSFGDVKAHSFTAIPEIIKNAVFIKSEDDKKKRIDILKVLKFESLIKLNDIDYEIWIYIRQTNQQLQLYSLNIKV
jgi:Large polyvalent protein-associated domain 3